MHLHFICLEEVHFFVIISEYIYSDRGRLTNCTANRCGNHTSPQPLGSYSFMLSTNVSLPFGGETLSRTAQNTSQIGNTGDDAREHLGAC